MHFVKSHWLPFPIKATRELSRNLTQRSDFLKFRSRSQLRATLDSLSHPTLTSANMHSPCFTLLPRSEAVISCQPLMGEHPHHCVLMAGKLLRAVAECRAIDPFLYVSLLSSVESVDPLQGHLGYTAIVTEISTSKAVRLFALILHAPQTQYSHASQEMSVWFLCLHQRESPGGSHY